MIYSGKEKGAFYIAHNIWDTNMSSRSIKYTINNEGQVKADTCVHNVVSIDPYEEPRDEYDIDGNSVSAEEGAGMFTAHRKDYNELLMYNMKYGKLDDLEDFKVFDNLKTDSPLAGSYDDIMKQLTE